MESEIQRWRAIASSARVTQRITLVPRKKKEKREREKATIARNVSQVSKIKLGKILDDSMQSYKKDMEIVTCGYLNPNNLLKAYKDENEKLIELLEEYDVVNHSRAMKKTKETEENKEETQERNETDETDEIKIKKQQFVPDVVPNPYLNVTKGEQLKTFKMIDQALVERSFIHVKGAVNPKADKLKEHLDFLKKELSEIEISDNKPSWDRLQVYSRCFENIIQEFKTYGPILAKIKKVYDDTISSFNDDGDELGFLRNKVQHLLAKNENRLLLKLERKKCKRLQEQINELKEQQTKLRDETYRKLSIYSAYIPERFLKDTLEDENPLLHESIKKIRLELEQGMDPLSRLENQVEGLKKEVSNKNQQVLSLQNSINEDFVPKASKELTDESLAEAKERLVKVLQQNREQSECLKNLHDELEKLKSTLKDKEQQYDTLSREFNELSEAAAISFDQVFLGINS